MVVDYNLFFPRMPLSPNTLWIVEQIPGWVMRLKVAPFKYLPLNSEDKTDILISTGYWASYNIV